MCIRDRFNVPDNATLNSTYGDSDNDGLSDWEELYKTYTSPFLVDTDNDGINDYWEYQSGSDPNNYSETFNVTIYKLGIRNDGIDYFIWLGQNKSAWYVAQQIANFDESSEYIAKWCNDTWSDEDGLWSKYFGDGTGNNFSVYTFDVIKIYLTDAGTQDISMIANSDINYNSQRTVTIINSTLNKGYNYTGYTSTIDNTLGGINGTNLTLNPGYSIGVWDNSTYQWIHFIAYFEMNADTSVQRWNVCETKVSTTRQWTI